MSEHSPLGASGADRWMRCPGSVALLNHLELPPSEEADYAAEGSAMHEAAAAALTEDLETYELVGRDFHDITITADLADPLQIYLNHCRPLMAASQTYGVEFRISSPVHPLFYGTADFWALAPVPPGIWLADFEHPERMALHVVDLKGGIGITVEVERNPQLSYYAFGVIDTLERQRSYVFDDDMAVVLTICQPRGFHLDGPTRSWVTTVGAIKAWTRDVLVPAMLATAYDNSLDAGSWCRFCPAKLVCPLLTALFRAAATASPDIPPAFSDEQLGLNYRYAEPVKMFVKALEKEALRRLSAGKILPWGDGKQLKVVYQKSNRVWNEGAAELAIHRYGADALDLPPAIWDGPGAPVALLGRMPGLTAFVKSPAQLEKVPAAKDWVKEFSHQPRGNLTVAPPDDPRPAIPIARLSERYEGVSLDAD